MEADLLPPTRVITMIQELAVDRNKKVEEETKRASGLSTSTKVQKARDEMVQKIARESMKLDKDIHRKMTGGGDDNSTIKTLNSSIVHEIEEEYSVDLNSKARFFLDKPSVKYGKGRLLSSFNALQPLEAPWSTTGGRYQPMPGDRTF